MKKPALAIVATGLLCSGLAAGNGLAHRQSAAVTPPVAPAADAAGNGEEHAMTVGRYCLFCHNDVSLKGNMSLESFDVTRPETDPELAERMIRKLRAGMMPPPEAQRPDADTLDALATWLETRVDAAAAADPSPGRRPFQRLNRAEYARSVRDLLGLQVDVAAYLPPDTVSHGFDVIADVQQLSPTLMEGYLRAADAISRLAVGDPKASPREATYKVPRTASQLERVDGAPFGTRGGISLIHTFPADGEYRFEIMLHSTPTGGLFGMTAEDERLEVSIDGERVALLEIDPLMSEADPTGMTVETEPVPVKAGPHRVTAAFLERFSGPVQDLVRPIEHSLADTQIGGAWGVTTLPHLRDLTISGPHSVTGVSDTPTRRRIFTCRPVAPEEELSCAREILSRLASRAYRRPADEDDLEGLIRFYEQGASEGGFEQGIRTALQAILASPHFVLRLEPAGGRAGPARTVSGPAPQPTAADEGDAGERRATADAYRIGDLALASRLSYFLWATVPDAELVALAVQGELSEPDVLREQVRRLLDDPRSEALATRFAAQWFRLQDLEKIHPDALRYPQYDARLAEALRRETELLFDSIVRQDRSVLELLTADYTFVNERLARHYGIRGVTGPWFRRVPIPDEHRRGILGHGSILTLTSHANRTSPVLRGKWVMEVLLGSPPPPPPPDIPELEAAEDAEGHRPLTVREKLEAHRDSPACMSCHRVIDPIGLALENYDVTGKWRIKDSGVPVDASGELYDGSRLEGPGDLRRALLEHEDAFITTFTENLMAYALGRRVEYFDMPRIRAIIRDAARHDYRLSSFVLGIATSPAFRMMEVPPPERSVAPDRDEIDGVADSE